MAVKKKVVEIDTLQATTSVKDLRNQLKQLKDTMLSTEQGTEEYNEALRKSAEIMHTLKEQNEELNASAMDFGQITGNVVKATGGLVAGLQAAKATMNLFGVENETVIKSLQQMQNLMAITQALPALDNGVKAFKRLGLVIKSATAGMNSFKAALVSTGIGAAVVALGLLVANWDKVTDAMKRWGIIHEDTKKKLEEEKKKIEEWKDKLQLANDEIRKQETADKIAGLNEEAKKSYDELTKSVTKLEQEQKKVEAERQIEWRTNGQRTERARELTEQFNSLTQQINDLHKAQRDLLNDTNNTKEAAEAAKKAAAAAKKAAEERKKATEQEKKEIEELKKKYNELSFDISLYGASEFQKDIAELNKAEQKAIKTIEDAEKKSVVTKEQAEKDKTAIHKYYAKERENASKEEAERQRKASIELIDTSYQLEQAKLQKQYDEKLISEKQFNDRKKELQTNYVQDYIDNIQFILDTEKNLTDEQILDLTNKINEARASLKEKTDTDPNVLTAKQISEAINASALALNDFSDNPAWGNILKNVATLAANWDTLHSQIKEGGSKAFTAYAQIAATALSAVAQMMNGLAAEQDTSNKEGFESSKKYQIAGATMSMLAGIASAWASSMQLMFPANVIIGSLLSGMMLTTGLMQIAKIKSTQFDGGSTSGASASPNASAVASIQAPVQYTQDVQGANIEGAIRDSRVYVVESDITNTQRKVSVTENEARF